jgi:RNA polymerase sigma-70 factor (ECF subfamily)
MHTTPVSLLDRLKDGHAPADWFRFAELYTPLLFYWARQLKLQDADAADLVQDVFARLWREIGSYHRREGKRFRAWLWTVTLNKWRERQRRKQLAGFANGTGDAIEAPDELGQMVEEEYNAYLVDRALQLMRAEFEPVTWRACWEFVVGGRSAADVAAELGITPNAVYLAKARVVRRLRKELDGLLE